MEPASADPSVLVGIGLVCLLYAGVLLGRVGYWRERSLDRESGESRCSLSIAARPKRKRSPARAAWQVGVFAGSFGLEAADQICSGAGLEREQIVDLVGNLVAKSILTMARGGRRGRYRLLETLRLYGAQRLAESGEGSELAHKHAAWYAERVSGGDRPWWARPEQREGLEWLDVEWASVETALDFFAGSTSDVEMGLRMASDLWLYWLVRGH